MKRSYVVKKNVIYPNFRKPSSLKAWTVVIIIGSLMYIVGVFLDLRHISN